MPIFFNRSRNVSNILGTIAIVIILCLFISSIPLLVISSFSFYGWLLLISSLFFNYLITVGVSITLINSNKRSDLFVVFYLFAFLLVPFISLFLYFFFGFDSIHMEKTDKYEKIYSRYKNYEKRLNYGNYLMNDDNLKIFPTSFTYNTIKNNTLTYTNVNVDIYGDASSTLIEISNLIKSAVKFIFLEFYLFCDGFVFEHIVNLLEQKVKEGVEVRLIVDHAGIRNRLSRKSIKRLKKSGINLRLFNPLFKSNPIWWQFRNHNKMLVIDNMYALTGSCNIADEYFNISKKYFQTTELSAKLSGPIVSSFTSMFLSHWDLTNKRILKNESEISDSECEYYFSKSESVGESGIAQFLDNSPVSNEFLIKDNLIQLIFNAKKSIIISTPYFSPSKDLINALKQMSVLGISIKILVPKNPDLFNFFRTLNRQVFSTLLDNGIQIYEYFGFNHEKVLIIDDEIVYIGSYNWDYRTLYLNFESALLVKCKKVSSIIGEFMEKQIQNSHRIFEKDISKGSNMLLTSVIRLFKPWL